MEVETLSQLFKTRKSVARGPGAFRESFVAVALCAFEKTIVRCGASLETMVNGQCTGKKTHYPIGPALTWWRLP
jgi:hypothetical protein